ncbi:ABC-type bacteriocin/lantibiotic exporter with double-glycine peptidase domain, partial [Pseudomonas fluvialis]
MEQQPGRQSQEVTDTGLACLVMLARFHNVAASPEQLAHEFAADGRALSTPDL